MRSPLRIVAFALLVLLAGCGGGGGGGGSRPATADLVALTTTSLEPASTGLPYDAVVEAVGPHAPLAWRITGGALPPGLTLDAETGRVSGWPRRTGRFGVTVEVRDGPDPAAARDVAFAADVRAFGLEVRRGPLTVLPFPPEPAQFNAPYEHAFEAAGGTEPYAFELVGGSLPPGLALTPNGRLAGVPTKALNPYTPRIRVTDGVGATAERTFDLAVVVLPLGIAPDAWRDAAQGFPYLMEPRVQPIGGGAPYRWELAPTSTPLPPGLGLDPDTGRIEGVATVVGPFAFRLQVTDFAGQTTWRDVTMRVNPGPVLHAVTPSTLPKAGGPVTLEGSGFQPGMTTTFAGGVPVPTTWLDATRATVVPPDVLLSGAVEVRVTNPDGGTYARPAAFRYPLRTIAFQAEGVKGAPGSLGSSRGIAVGDVDRDGRDDVVQGWSNGLQWIRNTGATYTNTWTPINIRTSGSYNDVKLADVDADGDLDLVTYRSTTTETIEVYLNTNATFPSAASTSTTIPKPTSNFPSSLAVGDVNGDGVVDVVLTSGGGGQGTLWVYRGLGNGTWQQEHVATSSLHDGINGCFGPNMVALADLNGDGRDDFVIVDAYPNACVVGQTCPTTSGVVNAFAGHDNLVAWTSLAGPTGSPLAWRGVRVTGGLGRLNGDNLGVAVYDHDGDGRADVAVCGGFRDTRGMGVAFLTGDGAGGFTERHTQPTTYNRRYGAGLDANLDGCEDVIVVGSDGLAGSFGASGYSVAELYLGGLEPVPVVGWRSGAVLSSSLPGANPGRVAVGDFDGDGLQDFAVDQSFNTKERFGNDQDDGTTEGVAIYLNRSH